MGDIGYVDLGDKTVSINKNSGQIKLKTPKTMSEATEQLETMQKVLAAADKDVKDKRPKAELRYQHVAQQYSRAITNAEKVLKILKGAKSMDKNKVARELLKIARELVDITASSKRVFIETATWEIFQKDEKAIKSAIQRIERVGDSNFDRLDKEISKATKLAKRILKKYTPAYEQYAKDKPDSELGIDKRIQKLKKAASIVNSSSGLGYRESIDVLHMIRKAIDLWNTRVSGETKELVAAADAKVNIVSDRLFVNNMDGEVKVTFKMKEDTFGSSLFKSESQMEKSWLAMYQNHFWKSNQARKTQKKHGLSAKDVKIDGFKVDGEYNKESKNFAGPITITYVLTIVFGPKFHKRNFNERENFNEKRFLDELKLDIVSIY